MSRLEIRKEYFEWLYSIVCEGRVSNEYSFRKLLEYLHEVEFTYRMKIDNDRASDGIRLRRRFANSYEDYDYAIESIEGPCSILEMMVALSIRCEEAIMTDPDYGDRTGQWFWRMIVNLGLGSMSDNRFDEKYVKNVINDFLKRRYEPDGRGGLFTIKNRDADLRSIDIWTQMMWYLDSMM